MKLVLLRMFPFKVMLTRELKMDKTTLQLELPTRLFFFFFWVPNLFCGFYLFALERYMLWVPCLFWGFMHLLLNIIFVHVFYFKHYLSFVLVTV